MRKLTTAELQRKTLEEFQESKKSPFVVVLDNVRSANNVGSMFRTSDAFLVEKLLLCGITATPPNAEIHKTALGAEKSLAWQHFANTKDAIADLKQNGYTVWAVEQTENSTSLIDFEPSADKKYAFVFGNEVKGVDQEAILLCDGSIEIPQFGTKHSFNVSVTAGIVLWDVFGKYSALR